jgi:hypothetical protein
MRLAELDPRWYTMGDSPDIVGVTFNCPCCLGSDGYRPRLGVLFKEEIDASAFGHWHGFITAGEVR